MTPLELEQLKNAMSYYENWCEVPQGLFTAIAMLESSFNPNTGDFRNVCNSVRACGLMQLKPIALADIKRVYKVDINPLNPIQSVVGAACLININRMYLRHHGINNPSPATLIVAYNGGWTQGRNYDAGRQVSREASNYISVVGKNYDRIRGSVYA